LVVAGGVNDFFLLLLLQLRLLALPDELRVFFVKNYFLYIVVWNLSNEKTCGISFFIALDNFVPEVEVLENLVKHIWLD